MNRVLVDTNVWVDVILKRPDFYEDSHAVLLACIEDDIEMMIAGTSLKDVFCWAEKSAGAQAAYGALELVFALARIASVDELACRRALELECSDYEDGIIAACAQIESADAIVTRDEKAFSALDVRRFSPTSFLAEQGWQPIALPQ